MFEIKTNVVQFFKFCVIGVLNTGIYFLVFMGLLTIFASQLIANFLGFCAGVTFSFFMNAAFTFKQKTTINKFIRMVLVSGTLSGFFGYLGDSYQWSPYMTFTLFVLVNPLISFFLTKKIVLSE